MLHIIYNPISGGGRLRARELQHRLTREKIPYVLHIASDPATASELQNDTEVSGEDILLLIGGDGSMNHLINLLPESSSPAIMLLPSGSGNDLARGIHMRRNIDSVIRILKDSRSLIPCDLDCGEVIRKGERRRFIVSCGIGYDAGVCDALDHSRLKKWMNRLHLGRIAYLIYGVQGILKYEKTAVTISVDGGREHTFSDLAFLSCHNLPYEGGGFAFAPSASARDGRLELCLVRAGNRFIFTLTLICSIFGLHTALPNVITASCREAVIRTDRALPFHTDGEVIGRISEYHVRSLPRRIPFLYVSEKV